MPVDESEEASSDDDDDVEDGEETKSGTPSASGESGSSSSGNGGSSGGGGSGRPSAGGSGSGNPSGGGASESPLEVVGVAVPQVMVRVGLPQVAQEGAPQATMVVGVPLAGPFAVFLPFPTLVSSRQMQQNLVECLEWVFVVKELFWQSLANMAL